ncbi:alcohol dehydrogenase catalytic domain-containing protein [Oceanobacter kriegii]|uniref:alcohol dehydrogenase catalytic domain-containing protein n=1 Tax=Oceanobacter kriegii TaxID=64972 RepID=UPI000426A5A1|nr:alcohol dehydrogenase catalytic domain-containing protein [Oceanobacter kriegii]
MAALPQRYRVMQVVRPGELELAERELPHPGAHEALIQVEACGLCGADIADIERPLEAELPRVPGHEIVGRIVALGEQSGSRWQTGQRVGVGRLAGPCLECDGCRRGAFNLCSNQRVVGRQLDGGYGEFVCLPVGGLVAIPEQLDSVHAAPVLCAGLATFNALRKCGASAGDKVAVFGIGGLGHMALQYAERMGFEVVAVGRGDDIAKTVRSLGAHHYIDTNRHDAVAALQALGGVQAIINTVAASAQVAELVAGLVPQGRMVTLNPAPEPLPLKAGLLVGGERQLIGSMTGTPHDAERALHFTALTEAEPMIELIAFEELLSGMARLREGAPMFRQVMDMTTRMNMEAS